MTKAISNVPNDPLLSHLIELQQELEKAKIPVILGGGMSLYLRLEYLPVTSSPRSAFPTLSF